MRGEGWGSRAALAGCWLLCTERWAAAGGRDWCGCRPGPHTHFKHAILRLRAQPASACFSCAASACVQLCAAHLAVVLALEHRDEGQAHGAVAVKQVLDLPAPSNASNRRELASCWMEAAMTEAGRGRLATSLRHVKPAQPLDTANLRRGSRSPVLLCDRALAGVLLVISAGQRGLQLQGPVDGHERVLSTKGCKAGRHNVQAKQRCSATQLAPQCS